MYGWTVALDQVPVTRPFWSFQYRPPSLPMYTRFAWWGSQASACWSTWNLLPGLATQLRPPFVDSIIGTPAENRWSALAGSTHNRANHQANPPSALSSAGSPVIGRVQVAPASLETKKPVRLPIRSLVMAYARLGLLSAKATPMRPGSVSGAGSGAPMRVQVSPPSVER